MRPRFFSVLLFGLALSAAAPAALLVDAHTNEARAAVSVLLSLDELVGSSTHVVVATAGERRSVWEDLPGGRRIVTYTRLTIERSIGDSPGAGLGPGKELEVRTLGGVVGSVGQAVSGDAKLGKGERALVFLTKTDRAFVVAGLAQGHFPIRADAKGTPRLTPSPDAGSLLPRRGPTIAAREELVGTTVEDAVAAVERAQRARHGR